MKERFEGWLPVAMKRNALLHGEITENKANEETIKIVSWLFTLYFEVSSFLIEKQHKMSDVHSIFRLNDYIYEAIDKKMSLEKVKDDIKRLIGSDSDIEILNDNRLFDIRGVEKYKKELMELINIVDKNSELFNVDDFDTRKRINLSSSHDYYLAKKMLMKHYVEHDNDHVTIEIISRIINDNKEYKFDLDSQNEAALQNLINDIKIEMRMNDPATIQNDFIISKITHAIRTASTSRGTTPAGGIQLDFWNLKDQWVNKAKKPKYSKVIGDLSGSGEAQKYSGADNIKKGLAYIKSKVSMQGNAKELYDSVVQKIEVENKNVGNVSDLDASKVILDKIKTFIEDLNKGEEKNSRSIALLSMIEGYQDLKKKFSLDNPADKMIELLTLQELLKLAQQITATKQEKNIDLLYRSCIDLMSIAVVLQLEGEKNQTVLMNDKNVIFPKVMRNTELEKNSSDILVGKGGVMALNAGLNSLDIPINYRKVSVPGFRLKTVLSQGKGEDEEKQDIAVYFEIGGVRGVAKAASKDDDVAVVGRISETQFDINHDDIKRLNENVIAWCENDKPKTICLDLTITKPNDELVAWMQSPDIKKLVQEKKLDILVWQSEQKQQSLGSGKFSAGSAYLISGDAEKIKKFNEDASIANKEAPDNNLSTFFRHYCTNAMHEVVKQQSESAKVIADQLNSILEKYYDAKAVANGPFVTIIAKKSSLKSNLQELLTKVWPLSYSFGFSQTTLTSWDDSSIRISVGLESEKALMEEVSAIIKTITAANEVVQPKSPPKGI